MKLKLKTFYDKLVTAFEPTPESFHKRTGIIAVVLVLIIAISLVSGSTIAYRTREAKIDNSVYAGNIRVALFNLNENGLPMAEFGLTGCLPGGTYTNIVYGYNDCNYDEFIRVSVEMTCEDKDGTQLDTSKFHPNYNTEDWTYKDGYWYYNHILTARKESKPLYTSIYFDTSIGNAYRTATLYVNLHVDAVQSINNGNSALLAEGWEAVS